MVLGTVENLKQPDALIIDRAGFQFMWPGEKPALGKVIELNDHRAVIAGISDASAPFTTFPVVYTKYSSASTRTARQSPACGVTPPFRWRSPSSVSNPTCCRNAR